MHYGVDRYLTEGCGRCKLAGTPECKVNNWPNELQKLRKIVLETGLNEEIKWGVPVYTFEKKNIVLVAAFKEYCSISFFKGILLKDTYKILEKAGKNSQSGMLIKFTDVARIIELEMVIKSYIQESIEIEKKGLKVNFKKIDEFKKPDELLIKFEENTDLKIAFEKLTPGRQRAYIIYFSAPKQQKTREERIEKYMPLILSGQGLYDNEKKKGC